MMQHRNLYEKRSPRAQQRHERHIRRLRERDKVRKLFADDEHCSRCRRRLVCGGDASFSAKLHEGRLFCRDCREVVRTG